MAAPSFELARNVKNTTIPIYTSHFNLLAAAQQQVHPPPSTADSQAVTPSYHLAKETNDVPLLTNHTLVTAMAGTLN